MYAKEESKIERDKIQGEIHKAVEWRGIRIFKKKNKKVRKQYDSKDVKRIKTNIGWKTKAIVLHPKKMQNILKNSTKASRSNEWER